MSRSLIDQYKICLERGHDDSHSVGLGKIITCRCKYCGTSFHDETVRREVRYHPDVYAYVQEMKEMKNG